MAYIELKNITKEYELDDSKINILKKINFEVNKGELVSIIGPSKSGKTPLLNILGCIDRPSSGEIIIDNKNICKLTERKLNKYRRENIGFVFQSNNLIKNLTVKENIELSSQLCKNSSNVDTVIRKVGLSKKCNSFSFSLSNSEEKLVAVARAIVKKPKIILCDELIETLDEKTGKQILKLLQSVAKKEKTIVIITTHNSNITSIANKVISLKNGSISNIKVNKKPKDVGDLIW